MARRGFGMPWFRMARLRCAPPGRDHTWYLAKLGVPIRRAAMYATCVARLAKMTQTALDHLDRPYAVRDIGQHFMPQARTALDGLHGGLPEICVASVERVVIEQARASGTLPMGYGSCCVRHFAKRVEQLEGVVGRISLSIESRFALIEVALLAGITGRWNEPPRLRTTAGSQRCCLEDAARLPTTAYVEQERWRAVIVFILGSTSTTATLIRNIACALVWCGCVSPLQCMTDEQLAGQFRLDRAAFVRGRTEALRLLCMLLELSGRPSAKGAP
jgi:hypothetical protein